MKAHWLIVPLIIMLIPLFYFSREQVVHRIEISDEGLDLNEEEMTMLIHEEEDSAIYESVSKFRMHMKSLDEYDDALAESIESQNWDDISKFALMLKNTSPLIFTGMRKVEMVKMNIEYEKLQKTCDDCHEKYKKKE